MKAFHICAPDIHHQGVIAHILESLDDKIELNRRMNETLEAMARAIFKSWFVDFDPVRAKAEGRKPFGMDSETAALFPDSFVDSPLGKVPKGWEAGRLDDILVLQRGFDLPMKKRVAGEIPVIASAGVTGFHNEAKVAPPGIVTGRSGSIGGVQYISVPFWPLNTTLWVKEFKSGNPVYSYFLLKNLNLERYNAGSGVPTLNRNHVHPLPCIIPPRTVMQAFENLTAPMFENIQSALLQSETLAAIRDTLLPKLLSGKIHVGDIATTDKVPKAVEAVVKPKAKRKPKPKAPDEFQEAVLISALVRELAVKYPLGRKRYTKFAYFVHRKAEHDVQQSYLKKAAGPYNPWTKYGGPEKIALGNKYIKHEQKDRYRGYVPGEKNKDIDKYIGRYGFDDALSWAVKTFRYATNDDLELFSTVDFAALGIVSNEQQPNVDGVKAVISGHPEWKAKLESGLFSDGNIARALKVLATYFPETYQ